MSFYGYARVSTLDQDLSIQRTALKAAGCEVIRAEKAGGARRDGRTELQVLLGSRCFDHAVSYLLIQPNASRFLRDGDTLVVTRIDRLARSLRDLQDIVHELKAKGMALKATEQPVDTGTAAGKEFLDMLGVFASSRPICDASASWKGSMRPRRAASIRVASRRSTPSRSCDYAARRNSAQRPSRAGSASVERASIVC